MWGSAHSPAAGQQQVDGSRRAVVDCRGHIRRQKRKPVRIRRGPATVTGVGSPGSQELSPPDSSNQGVDTPSDEMSRSAPADPPPVPGNLTTPRSAEPVRADRVFAYGAAAGLIG